ncbi:MAG: DUF5717 family protein, partial [Lachnospiraceae bacterium]|nr:DUF5717 family protein [Lachnospiraceae bacterium]
MKDIIHRILEGEFHPDPGTLEFSNATIQLELKAGEDYEGFFEVYGPTGRFTEGYVYSNSLEMECLTDRFVGATAEIAFCFHTQTLEEGETVQGEFTIVSNHGEYGLSYIATIIPKEIPSSLGPIRNLFHFANLAKTNWEEAVNLFYSEDFARLISRHERHFYSLFRGLSGGDSRSGLFDRTNSLDISAHHSMIARPYKNRQTVEEFLQAIRKKQAIEYLIRGTGTKTVGNLEVIEANDRAGEGCEVIIEAGDRTAEYSLSIHRNGWGYTRLAIEIQGDFIGTDKEMIREEDFLGNFYRLPFYIYPQCLHAGHNWGKIVLYNADSAHTISVRVDHKSVPVKGKKRRLLGNRGLYELMECYVAFRAKGISASVWRKETMVLVERMIVANAEDWAAQLFRVQLLLTAERYNEAGRLLDMVGGRLRGREGEEPALWCYHQYLTTLLSGSGNHLDEVVEAVEAVFARNRDNWRIAWLLLFLQTGQGPEQKWASLADQFWRGCTSPVIYVEVLILLQNNPTLLLKLDRFEEQVLLFAVKKQMLPVELVGQITYLAGKSKDYSPFLFRILQECYRIEPTVAVIKTICGLLIKGGRTGGAYLPWFRLGIEAEIKLIRLFEFYFMSLDLEAEETLPKMVLMYFAYNSDLDHRHRAYLYAYVHKHREEYPEIYASYQGIIERFVAGPMAEGRMNRFMAYLYEHYLSPEMITAENAASLAEALFTVQITIKPATVVMKELIVIYDKTGIEQSFPIPSSVGAGKGGVIKIPLYGDHVGLFLADDRGNRYTATDRLHIEKFIEPERFGRMIAAVLEGHSGFDRWWCENGEEMAAVTEYNRSAMERLLAAKELRTPFLKAIRMGLLRYYYEQDDMETLDRMIVGIRPEQIKRSNYAEILQLMVLCYRYAEAFTWLRATGTKGLDARLTMRVLSGLLDEGASESVNAGITNIGIADREDMRGELTALVYQAFTSGKYDERMLDHLN